MTSTVPTKTKRLTDKQFQQELVKERSESAPVPSLAVIRGWRAKYKKGTPEDMMSHVGYSNGPYASFDEYVEAQLTSALCDLSRYLRKNWFGEPYMENLFNAFADGTPPSPKTLELAAESLKSEDPCPFILDPDTGEVWAIDRYAC